MRLIDLFEGASDVLYHYTRMQSAIKILRSGVFELSSVFGSIEQQYAPKDHPYFLSCTRTLQGGYHNVIGTSAVMLNLDGRFYNANYKAKAVDYWGDRFNTYGRKSEAEDRIFSRKPQISASGISEIHIYTKPMEKKERDNWGAGDPALTRQILLLAKKQGIPTFLYLDADSWRMQDKRRAVPVSSELEVLKGPERTGTTFPRRSYIEPWLELVYKNKPEELSDRARRLYRDVAYAWSSNDKDLHGLDNDFSNARKPNAPDREHAVKLIHLMKKNNWHSVADMVKALREKWKAIANASK
jgi:hypothetical protein